MSEEKSKRRKSLVITGIVQLVMVLVLYFLVAWKEPYPPIEEFGIELSFIKGGTNTPPTAPRESQEVVRPSPEEPTDIVAEETPNPEPEEEIPAMEVLEGNEPVLDEVVEEVVDDPVEQIEEESDAVDEPTLFPESTTDEGPEEAAAAPVIDSRALFTNTGSGPDDGASLQLTGWIWDFEPTPYDDSSETGKVVFKITIDNEGYIVSVVTESSSLTPSVEKYYRQAVERLTFSKTSAYQPAPTSSGTITFIIKSD